MLWIFGSTFLIYECLFVCTQICEYSLVPNFLPLLIFPYPLLLFNPPLISFYVKNFQNIPQADILNKSSCLLEICLCFLHSHLRRRLIYELRDFHNIIILDFKTFIPTRSSAYSDPPRLLTSNVSAPGN